MGADILNAYAVLHLAIFNHEGIILGLYLIAGPGIY